MLRARGAALLVIFGLSTLVLAVKDSHPIPSLAPVSLGLILTWLTTVLPPGYVFFHTIKFGFPLGFLVYNLPSASFPAGDGCSSGLFPRRLRLLEHGRMDDYGARLLAENL